MDGRTILLDIDGPLARITLNRPAVLNALNLAWVTELDAAATAVAARRDVRVLLVRGAGRAFCAGLDLDMMGREGMPPGFYALQERAFRTLETMDAIVIAALHGYCLGGGLQLATACDIRICSTDCHLGLPAVLEGLFPGMSPYRLPRLIGLGPARRLILSGEQIGADEALRLGLVDHVVPAADFDTEAAALVEQYLQAPPSASAASKRLMASAFERSFEDAYAASLPLLADCLAAPEVAAAKAAWQRRRAARGKATD